MYESVIDFMCHKIKSEKYYNNIFKHYNENLKFFLQNN